MQPRQVESGELTRSSMSVESKFAESTKSDDFELEE